MSVFIAWPINPIPARGQIDPPPLKFSDYLILTKEEKVYPQTFLLLGEELY